ncbi:MAG: ribonuclease R [Pseudomonadota bacterium]
MSAKERPRRTFPRKEEILDFIRQSASPVGKREVARAFRLSGRDRLELKTLIKRLLEEGELVQAANRRLAVPEGLPPVAVLEISGTDADGEVLARPIAWKETEPPPPIYVAMERRGRAALWPGERILARVHPTKDGAYTAHIVRRIGAAPDRILGILEKTTDGSACLVPTDRRHKHVYTVRQEDIGNAHAGDLVRAEVMHASRRYREVRIVERLGAANEAGSVSLIAIHSHDIPTEFPPEALALANHAGPADASGRADLRTLPLVTIDGADARDFDDAVWAEADGDPKNPDGWHLLVAIADVAHYVRPGDALDRVAFERGNSAYFPDRVVPMLPESLSNGWCSLKPGEDRSCLAADLWIDGEGVLLRHEFRRGLMRSAARLTYEQVERAQNGFPDATTLPLLDRVIRPLYGAYAALSKARAARGTLELDLPERKMEFGAHGKVAAIQTAERYASHRLIEEFMILANVAASETLESRRTPCLYRVHDSPPPNKLEPLREFLASLNLRLAKGQVLRPHHFNRILREAAGTPYAEIVSLVVLRSQAKAEYNPENRGHFGLALRRYCHFTSPIRRYADLIVHRSLIRALRLGEDGLTAEAENRLTAIGEHISLTERRAEIAERDAADRYATLFLSERVGAEFAAQLTGVTHFGLFVTLDETRADGFIPIRTLGWERFLHDAIHHELIGERSRLTFRLGDRVRVRLAEANTATGSLLFELVEGGRKGKARAASPRGKGLAKQSQTGKKAARRRRTR